MPVTQNVIPNIESTQNVPSQRAVRDVADRIAYLDPDAAPLTVILMRSASQVASNWKFEWIEKELPARWVSINNGAGYSTTATANLQLDSGQGKLVSVGDILENVRTGEKIRYTGAGAGADQINVIRAVDGDGTTGTAMNDNDDLLIIGNAYAEGALSGTPKSVQEVFQYNYTQIVRTPFGVTRTEANTENYGGPDRTRLQMEKGIEHKIDLERTALFGERNLFATSGDGVDSAGNNPRRYTGGIFYFLQSLSTTAQVKDFGGTVTEPELEDWMQAIFNPTAAGDSRTLFASPLWVSIIDQLAMGRLQKVDNKDETFGVTVRQLITSHGQLNIVKHRLLENSPSPASATPSGGYAGYSLALDVSRVKYRFLRNSNTQLHTNIQAPDYDGYKDEYLTECGWHIELAKVHGIGKGATN